MQTLLIPPVKPLIRHKVNYIKVNFSDLDNSRYMRANLLLWTEKLHATLVASEEEIKLDKNDYNIFVIKDNKAIPL